jgi:hypothetical protein
MPPGGVLAGTLPGPTPSSDGDGSAPGAGGGGTFRFLGGPPDLWRRGRRTQIGN